MVGEGFNTWSLILRSCAQPHPRIQGNLQNTGIVLKTKGLCWLVPGRTCQTAVYIQSRPPCHCSTYHKMKDARKKGSLPSLTSRYLLRRKSVFCGHPFSLLFCTPSRLPLDWGESRMFPPAAIMNPTLSDRSDAGEQNNGKFPVCPLQQQKKRNGAVQAM